MFPYWIHKQHFRVSGFPGSCFLLRPVSFSSRSFFLTGSIPVDGTDGSLLFHIRNHGFRCRPRKAIYYPAGQRLAKQLSIVLRWSGFRSLRRGYGFRSAPPNLRYRALLRYSVSPYCLPSTRSSVRTKAGWHRISCNFADQGTESWKMICRPLIWAAQAEPVR